MNLQHCFDLQTLETALTDKLGSYLVGRQVILEEVPVVVKIVLNEIITEEIAQKNREYHNQKLLERSFSEFLEAQG